MPVILGGVGETLFSTGKRKTVTSLFGLVAATCAAIGGIKAEAGDIDYIAPAHRGYVRWYADDVAIAKEKEFKISQQKVERVLMHIQREQADGKLEATENDLFKAGLELKKAQDDQTREYVNQQILKLQATKGRLEKQIETLSKAPE